MFFEFLTYLIIGHVSRAMLKKVWTIGFTRWDRFQTRKAAICKKLDQELPLWVSITALARVQVALNGLR